MSYKKALFMLGIITLLLTGCGKKVEFVPVDGNIFMKKDGGVISADIESFDKPVYSQEELTAFIESYVIRYNTETAGIANAYQSELAEEDDETILPVAINRCEVEEQSATLLLDYRSAEDYLAFNVPTTVPSIFFEGLESYADPSLQIPEGLFGGTTEALLTAGYSLPGDFIKIADSTSVSGQDAVADAKSYGVIVEGAAVIQVEGKITYTSVNVEVIGTNSAVCKAGEVSYIIYK